MYAYMLIGITLGDPSGIGPEIILKSAYYFKRHRDLYIFGSTGILEKTAVDLELKKQYRLLKDRIIDCVDPVDFNYGRPNVHTGKTALHSIDCSLKSLCDIIVTPPIVKEVITRFRPGFIGHTEYFADYHKTRDYAMVGIHDKTRIMLLTTHQPLRRAIDEVKISSVVTKLQLLDHGLKKYFRAKNPKIAVSALNPHAFEFSLGEDESIKKAVMIARRRGINADGPFSADTIFQRRFDGFLTMYHDQAMIFLKSKKDGLNFTLGLPRIRLSPLYGAALDIAGRNIAENSGLINAVRIGIQLHKNARDYGSKK